MRGIGLSLVIVSIKSTAIIKVIDLVITSQSCDEICKDHRVELHDCRIIISIPEKQEQVPIVGIMYYILYIYCLYDSKELLCLIDHELLQCYFSDNVIHY